MIKKKSEQPKLSHLLSKIFLPESISYLDDDAETYFPDIIDIHVLVDTLTLTLNLYDQYTAGHSFRVAALAEKISRQFDRTELEHQRVHIAAHLHDIGKIGIPKEILNKPGRLSSGEFDQIKRHPIDGFEIINNVDPLSSIAKIILYHHEKHDGTGYPFGAKGNDIPLDSRIIAVADAFDAMTSTRPYQSPMIISHAANEIITCSGTQFDPDVVNKFLDLILELRPVPDNEGKYCQIEELVRIKD